MFMYDWSEGDDDDRDGVGEPKRRRGGGPAPAAAGSPSPYVQTCILPWPLAQRLGEVRLCRKFCTYLSLQWPLSTAMYVCCPSFDDAHRSLRCLVHHGLVGSAHLLRSIGADGMGYAHRRCIQVSLVRQVLGLGEYRRHRPRRHSSNCKLAIPHAPDLLPIPPRLTVAPRFSRVALIGASAQDPQR